MPRTAKVDTDLAIIRAGRQAELEINGARLASQTAWNKWRNVDTFQTEEGTTQSLIPMPTITMTKKGTGPKYGIPALPIAVQLDTEHPRHHELRLAAEACDRHVCELENAIEDMTIVQRGNSR